MIPNFNELDSSDDDNPILDRLTRRLTGIMKRIKKMDYHRQQQQEQQTHEQSDVHSSQDVESESFDLFEHQSENEQHQFTDIPQSVQQAPDQDYEERKEGDLNSQDISELDLDESQQDQDDNNEFQESSDDSSFVEAWSSITPGSEEEIQQNGDDQQQYSRDSRGDSESNSEQSLSEEKKEAEESYTSYSI